ncbi:MAG: hypothetical protein J0I20_11905 [Chloroflexi bacterium]|nr:hypothetical protein [Chloroflexota bacterium]OJV92433.1 MAG: hypothetical protein BGO39_31420 [Chloroflexi bacterium 54-19]
MDWQNALENLLEVVYLPLKQSRTEWLLVGSAATAVAGCDLTPGDLDILARTPEGVRRFSELLADYAPADCVYPPGHEKWQSSRQMPVCVMGEGALSSIWHFGRWYIDGFKIEVAHIAPPADATARSNGTGIWENGPEIWPYRVETTFKEFSFGTVPLEIQLETNFSRGLSARTAKIIKLFRQKGYDRELLLKSLSPDHLQLFEQAFSNPLS